MATSSKKPAAPKTTKKKTLEQRFDETAFTDLCVGFVTALATRTEGKRPDDVIHDYFAFKKVALNIVKRGVISGEMSKEVAEKIDELLTAQEQQYDA